MSGDITHVRHAEERHVDVDALAGSLAPEERRGDPAGEREARW
jgi:hypothetical protein